MENVPGLQLFDNGRFLQRILRMFHNAGYQVDVAVLNAADYGVPQTRQRTFVLGNRVAAVNYFPSPKTPSSQWVTVWEAISDLPSALSDGQNGALRYAAGRPSAYAQQMRNNAATQVLNNEISKNSELILRRYKHIPQGGNWRNIPPHLMRNYSDKSRCHQLIYQRLLADKPATVIANVRKSMLIHPFEDRGLSIREAARLQSFPDTFTFKGGLEAQQQQIANGVPPLLATAVASTILNRMIRSATPFSRMLSIAPDLLPTRGLPKPISRFARRNISYFRGRLSTWAAKHLRQLPWRTTADPFRILVAEVLLQKTTAAQAREAFSTIVSEFTSIESLAQADLKRLKQIIRPIGLPNRAARLKSIAQTVMRDYRGIIPSERKDLASLPGIGPYIAAATACFAHGQAVPIVDTNVVRIFQRFFGLKSKVPRPHSDPLIWRFASILVSRDNPQKYNNALIDLGALVCTHRNPKCELCPLRARCIGRTAQ
jgi:DNA-cytosine methyltransferase